LALEENRFAFGVAERVADCLLDRALGFLGQFGDAIVDDIVPLERLAKSPPSARG
jgi:hypothetical protein